MLHNNCFRFRKQADQKTPKLVVMRKFIDMHTVPVTTLISNGSDANSRAFPPQLYGHETAIPWIT